MLSAVPLIGILVVSSIGSRSAYGLYQEAKKGEAATQLTEPLGALIHELQVERGLSAGFISTGGADSFAIPLAAQRTEVDTVLTKVREISDALPFKVPDDAALLTEALAGLEGTRGEIDQKQPTVPEMAGYYTSLIRKALHANEMLLSHLEVGDIARAGAGWIALSEAKEAAGLERATGAAGFGSGAFPPRLLSRFYSLQQLKYNSLEQSELYADVLL